MGRDVSRRELVVSAAVAGVTAAATVMLGGRRAWAADSLVGVTWDPGRGLGLLDDLHVRVGADQKLAFVAHPGAPRAGLAVGQREHNVAEQLGTRSERLVG